ncbi:dihydrofolate reductase family protein [Pseudonocardia acaciae]|uniref:dihydrofolate reductase family protein n=1 Tax=Pseudonocardia acaciae TaxID=551276 RepID=UPI0004913B9D|nr:dihydrofolate reductase family protein [Pseudonocardia acaciae]
MRTLIVSAFVTLDGVMEAPGGEPGHPHTDWVRDYEDAEQIDHKMHEMLAAELLLIGRVTYESFAGAWPTYTGEFADRMNGMPKYVVSSTLTDPAWNNTTVLRGDVVKEVAALKADGDGQIVVQGSTTLVHALLENDLVDELRLMVFPVTVGFGARVFPRSTKKTSWRVTGSRTFPSQAREDIYRRIA